MNKNTILGLLLIFALLMGYSYFTRPSQEQREKMEQERKSAMEAKNVADSTAAFEAEKINEQEKSSQVVKTDSLNVFSFAAKGENKIITIENDFVIIKVQSLGGRIASVMLKDYTTYGNKPVTLFDAENSDFYLSFNSTNLRHVETRDLYFTPVIQDGTDNIKVTGNDSVTFSMRLYQNNEPGKYIDFQYTIKGNDYMLGFRMNFMGMNQTIISNANFIDLTWNADLLNCEKSHKMESQNTAIYFKPATDKVDYLSETRNDQKKFTTPIQWISFKQQFFSVSLIPQGTTFVNADLSNYTDEKAKYDSNYLKTLKATVGVPFTDKDNQSIDFSMYFGPNKYKTLRNYHIDLERQIPLGWSFFLMQWINRFAVLPVFNFLEKFDISYGIIILILTILLKIVLLPIAYKSYLSTAKMRVIKPEVEELAKKFPKPEQAMDKQRATMALYKKAGINQMAGCIPQLLQFPILIAMFRFFPAAIELRHQPFLWAEDLSSFDSILQLPFNIPFYGDHVSLFALLMAVSNLISVRVSFKQQGSASMPGMKMMMYVMPVMFLGLLNSYSSALNYYYVLSTCFTFFQTWLIKQFLDENKIHLQIQENKKKVVKKSKWQVRMEQMMKQQEQLKKQKK